MQFTGLFYKFVSNILSWLKMLVSKKSLIIIGIIFISTVLLIRFANTNSVQTTQVQGTQTTKLEVIPAKATKTLNKEFSFPIKDDRDKDISSIKYIVQDAVLQDEIIVKGQKATAIKGRSFLIFNLKITNSHSQSIQVNTRDYLRISINGSNELLAPDIHNDPVEIQPISTKLTRLGLPIDESNKNFKVQIGEIDGDKQTFDLNF